MMDMRPASDTTGMCSHAGVFIKHNTKIGTRSILRKREGKREKNHYFFPQQHALLVDIVSGYSPDKYCNGNIVPLGNSPENRK